MEKIRIAIADDHEMVRSGLAALIESFGGYKVVIQASNGAELLSQLNTIDTQPDICIVDISMPVMNGYDTVAAVRREWPEIRILALTMLDTEYCVLKMLNNGAHGYILKGDGPEKLKSALNGLFAKGGYARSFLSEQLSHIDKNAESPKLSDREKELLSYICTEKTYVEIADEMGITARSVEGYRDNLFNKFKVNSRISLAMLALRFGYAQMH